MQKGLRMKKCSICKTELETIKDFGKLPLSNELLDSHETQTKKYRLELAYCKECELLQLATKLKSEILFKNDYPYKSGVSQSFKEHCKTFAENLIEKTKDKESYIILEIGGNDGTLAKEVLKNNSHVYYYIVDPCFPDYWNIDEHPFIIGIKKLFDKSLFPHLRFDLIIFQNSFAHLPNPEKVINDCYSLLKKEGEIIIELPIAEYTVKNSFWETVYFEHQYYWSVGSLKKFMLGNNMKLNRINHFEEIQGGSARFYFSKNISTGIRHFTNPEKIYPKLQKSILEFEKRRENLKEFIKNIPDDYFIVGITAPAKAALLLRLLDKEEIEKIAFLADDTKDKQGKFLACHNRNISIRPFDRIPKNSVLIILSRNYEKVLSEKVKAFEPRVIYCP